MCSSTSSSASRTSCVRRSRLGLGQIVRHNLDVEGGAHGGTRNQQFSSRRRSVRVGAENRPQKGPRRRAPAPRDDAVAEETPLAPSLLLAEVVEHDVLGLDTEIEEHVDDRLVHHRRSAHVVLDVLGRRMVLEVVVEHHLVDEAGVAGPLVLRQRVRQREVPIEVVVRRLDLVEVTPRRTPRAGSARRTRTRPCDPCGGAGTGRKCGNAWAPCRRRRR